MHTNIPHAAQCIISQFFTLFRVFFWVHPISAKALCYNLLPGISYYKLLIDNVLKAEWK